MGLEILTDKKIEELLLTPKKVVNPSAKRKEKESHIEYNYQVISLNQAYKYSLYYRQNIEIKDDFSCGLSWLMPSGETVTLKRYNGSSHSHPNKLEKQRLGEECHIHITTERYILANRKPEGYAISAKGRYQTVDGALHCLLIDCNISGLKTNPDHPDLFDEY